jgi:predicted anti-sigma-YlaC factor YlaD/predicted negative regulator of RcsB-dependent stress response
MKSDCDIIRELATAPDAHLAPQDRAMVEQHLAQCHGCRAELHWLRTVADRVDAREKRLDARAAARIRQNLLPVMEQAAKTQRRGKNMAWRPFAIAIPAAAAALAVAALVLWNARTEKQPAAPRTSEVAAAVPARLVLRSAPSSEPETRNQTLAVGQTLRTTQKSSAMLQLLTDRVRLLERTELRLERSTRHSAALRLRRGTIHVHVEKGQGRNVVVLAPFGRVEVVGTRFAVSSRDGGRVTTLAGAVRVTIAGHHPVMVRAAQSLRVRDMALLAAASSRLEPLRLSFSAEPLRLARSGALLIRGEPRGAEVHLDGRFVGYAPLWLRHASGKHRYEIVVNKRNQKGTITVDPRTTARVTYNLLPASRLASAKRGQYLRKRGKLLLAVSALVAQRACDKALRLERKSRGARQTAELLALVAECYQTKRQTTRALAVYRRIVRRYRHTLTATNALFEIGRLLAAAGRPAKARRAFAAYLAKGKSLPLAAAARFRLCRCDIALKRYRSAVNCLQRYRKKHRTAAQRHEAVYLEARLRKDALDDCANALPLYRRYLAAKTGRRIEQAHFGRLDCLRRLRDARFVKAARHFLARFPHSKKLPTVRRWFSSR